MARAAVSILVEGDPQIEAQRALGVQLFRPFRDLMEEEKRTAVSLYDFFARATDTAVRAVIVLKPENQEDAESAILLAALGMRDNILYD